MLKVRILPEPSDASYIWTPTFSENELVEWFEAITPNVFTEEGLLAILPNGTWSKSETTIEEEDEFFLFIFPDMGLQLTSPDGDEWETADPKEPAIEGLSQDEEGEWVLTELEN